MKPGIAEAVKALGLAPASAPEPVSAWPPAYGWWILLALALICGFLLYTMGYRRHLKPALYRLRQRQRLRSELEPLLVQLAEPESTAAYHAAPASINVTLKSWAMSLGHRDAASLAGDEWLRYLIDQSGLSNRDAASLHLLGDASYRRAPAIPEGAAGTAEIAEFRRSLQRLIRSLPSRNVTSREEAGHA